VGCKEGKAKPDARRPRRTEKTRRKPFPPPHLASRLFAPSFFGAKEFVFEKNCRIFTAFCLGFLLVIFARFPLFLTLSARPQSKSKKVEKMGLLQTRLSWRPYARVCLSKAGRPVDGIPTCG
jgi:hypothetical protein